MPHAIQNPCLFAIQGTNLLIEQNATVSVYGHQGGAKFMHALSQKMRAILIELLELQIRVEQALQHVTALTCLLSFTLCGIKPSKTFVPCHQVIEKIMQHAFIDRLEQNTQRSHRMPFEKWDYILPIDKEDVGPVGFEIYLFGKRQFRTYIPDTNVSAAGFLLSGDHTVVPVPPL